jgi:hypothetical protein
VSPSGVKRASILTHAATEILTSPAESKKIDPDQAILARANYHMRQIAAIHDLSKNKGFQGIKTADKMTAAGCQPVSLEYILASHRAVRPCDRAIPFAVRSSSSWVKNWY